MPETTGEQPVSRAKEEIIREASRIEEDTLYTSKGHFYAAQVWSLMNYLLGIPATVLAAGAAATALGEKSTIAAVIAIIVAGLTALSTFINPKEKAGAHLSAGNYYDGLMNKTRIFRTVECWQIEEDLVLTERLKALSEEKARLNQSFPQVPWWAYSAAKRGIENGEAEHQVDKPAAT